jgi:hypothetical protein
VIQCIAQLVCTDNRPNTLGRKMFLRWRLENSRFCGKMWTDGRRAGKKISKPLTVFNAHVHLSIVCRYDNIDVLSVLWKFGRKKSVAVR